MNPPGIYDKDPVGFYFIDLQSEQRQLLHTRGNRRPAPNLGTREEFRTLLQLSIANHLKDEIRRQHSDSVFAEGWALYGEEMLRVRAYTQTTPRHRPRSCA